MRSSDFRKQMERSASAWFATRELMVRANAPYILHSRDAWADNLILPQLASNWSWGSATAAALRSTRPSSTTSLSRADGPCSVTSFRP